MEHQEPTSVMPIQTLEKLSTIRNLLDACNSDTVQHQSAISHLYVENQNLRRQNTALLEESRLTNQVTNDLQTQASELHRENKRLRRKQDDLQQIHEQEVHALSQKQEQDAQAFCKNLEEALQAWDDARVELQAAKEELAIMTCAREEAEAKLKTAAAQTGNLDEENAKLKEERTRYAALSADLQASLFGAQARSQSETACEKLRYNDTESQQQSNAQETHAVSGGPRRSMRQRKSEEGSAFI